MLTHCDADQRCVKSIQQGAPLTLLGLIGERDSSMESCCDNNEEDEESFLQRQPTNNCRESSQQQTDCFCQKQVVGSLRMFLPVFLEDGEPLFLETMTPPMACTINAL